MDSPYTPDGRFIAKCGHVTEYGFKRYAAACYVEEDMPRGNWGMYQTAITYVLNRFHCCSLISDVIRIYDEAVHHVEMGPNNLRALEQVFQYAVREVLKGFCTPDILRVELDRFMEMYMGFNGVMVKGAL